MATLIHPGSNELLSVPAPLNRSEIRKLLGHAKLRGIRRPDGSYWWSQNGGPAVLAQKKNERAAQLAHALFNDVGAFFGPVLITSEDESPLISEE